MGDVNKKVVESIINDLKSAESDYDVMRFLACGYYALYCGYTKKSRELLDECMDSVRKSAVEKAEELERMVSEGYIIKE